MRTPTGGGTPPLPSFIKSLRVASAGGDRISAVDDEAVGKAFRELRRSLVNDYVRRNPAPVVPASRDEIEELQDRETPWLTECPECGEHEFTATYSTYADASDRLALDDKGKVTDVEATYPRMPEQVMGDLASLICESCMTTIWSNPYL